MLTIEESKIFASRSALGSFLKGTGIEVGAGNRPFPVPQNVEVIYGDVRDSDSQKKYFNADIPESVKSGNIIDAQSLSVFSDCSFDFIISAHVIEHLFDPIGSICNSIRILRPGGIFLLVIPDMRYTFDRTRPETPLRHIISDSYDGGESTRLQAYEEHVRFVHSYLREPIPESDISMHAEHIMHAGMDIHVHAWTQDGSLQMLRKGSVVSEQINRNFCEK